MVIIVKQGQRVELTTKEAGLSRIMIGLGWNPVETSQCEKYWNTVATESSDDVLQEVDCDVSVLLLDAENKLRRKEDIIYFRNLKSSCRGVKHLGDNLTGAGEGDDEQILVDLKLIPPVIHSLLFVVTLYECEQRKQDLSLIRNAFIRIVNLPDYQEIIRFNLTGQYACNTALLVGDIYRTPTGWEFRALGEGTDDTSLFQIAKRFT